jgi:hypothetical protein
MISRLLPIVAMVLALAGASPGLAHADWDDRPDPTEFEESLSPHGYWVDDAQFGRVWRPNTWWTWRPYVDGHWIWTSYGWTWASDEPWGWTFHYGRWGFSNLYGWVWTPGYVWGPAWVDWYWGDGYVGWVPLGPPGFAIAPTYWTYVNDFSFCSPRITNVIVVHDRLPRYIVHHREQGWGRRHPPDFRDIEHVSRFRVERAADRPDHSIAPWVKHRMERGERVRERIADRGGERVLEHPGRNANDGRGRPRVSDDGGWRRPNERSDRGPHVIDRGRERDDDDGDGRGSAMRGRADDGGRGSAMHGRPDDDRRSRGDADDGLQPRRDDEDARTTPPSRGREDGAFGRSSRGYDGERGWRHQQQPERSQPFEAPPRVERQAPTMGHHSAGAAPTFVERGQRAPTGGGPTPRGDMGSPGGGGGRGAAPAIQHGGRGAAPSGGQGNSGGGWEHGGGAVR